MSTTQEPPFLACFIQHQNDLLSFLSYKLSCADTAADLVQETYLRVARYADNDEVRNPRALLFHIANNLALDHLRKRSLQDQSSNQKSYHELASHTVEPATSLSAIQQLEILEQLIDGLPPTQRKVFLLCRIEGKSYKAIATELSISERTVENHMYKALKTLKNRFDGYSDL